MTERSCAAISVLKSASFEHRFWLQILGDHSRFIYEALQPSETKDIKKAANFIKLFDSLLDEAKSLTESDVASFSKRAANATKELRKFKLSIIKRQLEGKIGIRLSPTFLSHMVNELEEYQLVLKYLQDSENPPVFHELHHHLLWLLDASGHANSIHDELDGVEKRLKEKSAKFARHFDDFYLEAVNLTGYLRANIESFPALHRFNNDVEVKMGIFRDFLHELEEFELSAEVLGTFSALMADHMAREECYYLMKLSESADTKMPNCDPTKTRVNQK